MWDHVGTGRADWISHTKPSGEVIKKEVDKDGSCHEVLRKKTKSLSSQSTNSPTKKTSGELSEKGGEKTEAAKNSMCCISPADLWLELHRSRC